MNIPFSEGAGGDQAVQYRELFLTTHSLIKAAGWTVLRSSDGTTADATDNVSVVGDVVFGTAGSQTLTWVVYRSPVGWLDASAVVHMLFSAENANSDTTPQAMRRYFSAGEFTGGTTTVLPTSASATTTHPAGTNYVPWTTAQTGYMFTQRSSRGDFRVGVKQAGNASFGFLEIIQANTDASGGGTSGNRFMFYAEQGPTITNLAAGNSWRGITADGSAVATTECGSVFSTISSWAAGLDSEGELITAPFEVFHDMTLGRGRWLGTLADVWSTPAGTTFGLLDDSESAQVQRRVVVGSGVMLNGITTADLPFL
jgi:hypothetical protein